MFSLELETRPGWLHVTARGVLDERSDRAIDERLVDECRRLGLERALVDIRAMEGRLGVVGNFEAASDFGRRVNRVLRRVAIVDDREHAESNRLFENAAVNRGANVRFFESVDAAELWLAEA